jgi:hypothetical protein
VPRPARNVDLKDCWDLHCVIVGGILFQQIALLAPDHAESTFGWFITVLTERLRMAEQAANA